MTIRAEEVDVLVSSEVDDMDRNGCDYFTSGKELERASGLRLTIYETT